MEFTTNGQYGQAEKTFRASIPAELAPGCDWVAWKAEWEQDPKTGKPKLNKKPIKPDPLKLTYASHSDPATWGTLEWAWQAMEAHDIDGVGKVFHEGDDLFGIDLDKCRNKDTGEISKYAQNVLKKFDTYAEVSPSGTGIKLWLYGTLPGDRCRNDEIGVEMYGKKRFFTVTGEKLPDAPRRVSRPEPELVDAFYWSVFPPEANGHGGKGDGQGATSFATPAMSDDEVLAHLRSDEGAANFARAYDHGDVSAWDNNRSKADWYVVKRLAFYTQDAEQIERIFSTSALAKRGKWGNREDYRRRTIMGALNKLDDNYQPKGQPSRNGHGGSGEVSGEAGEADKPEGNAAERIIAYVTDGDYELFVDQNNMPHILDGTSAVELTPKANPLFRRLFWEKEHKTVARDALQTARDTLAAFALDENDRRELHTRAAFVDSTLYYELGPGRFVVVSADGWHIATSAPVLFRRIPNLQELPDPVRGGSLTDGAFMLNLKDEKDKRLFEAYTVLAVLPHIQRYILMATGTNGAGKSTASRYVKRLLDPSKPESIRMDKKEEVLQKASHAFLVMLDNETRFPEWAVNTLCRLVTGESDGKRVLYSDDDDFVYEMIRGVLLNGINTPADRPDFMDRCLTVEFERIHKGKRLPEEELWERFYEARPRILGAVFDALAKTLRAYPDVHPDSLPRLADWGRYAAAFYEAHNYGADRFSEDWEGVERSQNLSAYDGSPVAQIIIAFMDDIEEARWEGTARELHMALVSKAYDKRLGILADPEWPKTERKLWHRIREVAAVLEAANITADRDRSSSKGTRITLTRSGDNSGNNGSNYGDTAHSGDNSKFTATDNLL